LCARSNPLILEVKSCIVRRLRHQGETSPHSNVLTSSQLLYKFRTLAPDVRCVTSAHSRISSQKVSCCRVRHLKLAFLPQFQSQKPHTLSPHIIPSRICDLTQLFVLEGYQYAPSSGRYRSAMGGPTQLFELRADMDMSYLCTAAAEIARYLRRSVCVLLLLPLRWMQGLCESWDPSGGCWPI